MQTWQREKPLVAWDCGALKGEAVRLLRERAELCSQQYMVTHSQAARPASHPASRAHGQPPGLAGCEPLAILPSSNDSGFPPAEWEGWLLMSPHPSPGPEAPCRPTASSKADLRSWDLLF